MNGLVVLKTVNYFSLIFIILNTIFAFDKGISYGGLIFLWIIALNTGILAIKGKYLKIGLFGVQLLVPMLLSNGINDFIFIILMNIFAVIFIRKETAKSGYGRFYDEFRNGCFILLVVAGAVVISFNTQKIGNLIAPYVIIYLISSISILRSLRIKEYTKDSRLLDKLNLRYSVLIIFTSFILSIEAVRKIVFYLMGLIYEGIAYIFFLLAQFVYIIVGIGLQKLILFIQSLIKHKQVTNPDKHGVAKAVVDKKKEAVPMLKGLFESQLFSIIMWAIIILVLLYIILRVYKKSINKNRVLDYYDEEKEFIEGGKEGRRKLKHILGGIIRPRDNSQYIRFYYEKYLELCLKKDINIGVSDTSRDVNVKAEKYFNRERINTLREIYIRIRYANREASMEDRKSFAENFKRIKQ